jgi:hypothetical protein
MGYNVGTDFMDLTGSAGFEINTTNGALNIQANGGKIQLVTYGDNIELAANTSGLGVFADVIISSTDGLIELGTGGNIEFLATEVITKSLAVIEGGTPTLRFQTSGVGPTSVDVAYNPTGSVFSESVLTTSAHEIGVYTGVVGENIAMGVNQALQTGYISGQGLPLFIGENGASSYAGLFLGNGNNPTDFLILDRKDNTDVTQTACSIALTGAGILNIESQLATGGIGISTTNTANITIASGQGVGITSTTDTVVDATGEIQLKIGGATQARLAGGGNIGVGGDGADGSVFLIKNGGGIYGAFNYNSIGDTLNMDNGGSTISVGAGAIGIGLTTTGATSDINLTSAQNISLNSVNNFDIISANQITLTTTNSTSINLTTDADLIFTGVGIQSATASGSASQYLRIKLNGTFYKILLEND